MLWKKILNRINTVKTKKNLKTTIEKSIENRNSDIKTTLRIWNELQRFQKHTYDEFYNVCLYSSIVTRDISVLWSDYSLTNSKTKKNLYGRLLSMTIIEFLDDINGLLGKNLRKELESNHMGEFIHELKVINKEFSKIKKQYNTELRLIRNNSTAHKSKKAKDLITYTEQIHFKNLHKISINITETNAEFNRLSTKIIYKITERIKLNTKKLRNQVIQ